MRNFFGAALGAVILGAAAVAPPHGETPPDTFIPTKRGKGRNNRQGKGKSNPPKSRPNRQTISARVRRKHRRAA